MAAQIKSDNTNLTLNADGSNDIKFQSNGVEKASISSAGAFTSTTIDATALTGALPAIDGSSLTGISSVGGATGVDFNDNVKAQFGASDDLQIYHNGSHSYVDEQGSGNLYLRGSNNVSITNATGTECANFASAGAVDLYHNGSSKLTTTATGVSVTGDLSVSGSISGAGKVLQVIQTHITATSSQSISSDTPANCTNLNATITPASTSSKILVMVRWNGTPPSNRWETVFGIHRDSTVIGIATAGNRRAGIVGGANLMNNSWTGGDGMYGIAYSYLDTPNTTSATTYHGYIHVETGGTLYNNRSSNDTDAGYIERGTSSVILMEIGA